MKPDRSKPVRIGTRGSALALAQSEVIAARLRELHPALDIEIRIVRTSGDNGDRTGMGVFVAALQDALLRGEIDLAVHSMKDLPTARPEGLQIAAVPVRADPRDVLVSAKPGSESIASGARIGTGSPRRAAQLLALQPDLNVLPLSGNVDTRLRRLVAGDFDAVVLALAGLKRLGLPLQENAVSFEGAQLGLQILAAERMMPAPGQGALGTECRCPDHATLALAQPLHDAATERTVTAERAFLARLGGGCRAAIGALAEADGERITLRGVVLSVDGANVVRGEIAGPPEEAEILGAVLAEQLLGGGAAEILRASNASGSAEASQP